MSEKKVAIVTGGSRGIGKAIAKKLAETGHTVVINYRGSEEKAKEVQTEIERGGGEAFLFPCDVADYKSCEDFIKEVMDRYGRIDVLVNNAGITRDGLIMKMSEEDFDAVINTNLKGAFHCIRFAVRPMMKQRFGRIINISSVSGIMGNPGQANYSASKAGIIGLTKSVAREIASKSVTVNAIAPGFIETDMTEGLPEKVKESYSGQIPLGHFGKPEDIANTAAFLASEEAGYITGQVLCVDGGMAM